MTFHLENRQLVFIQYLFDEVEHPIQPKADGNSKRRHPPVYVLTKESIVKKLQHESASKPLQAAYHSVHEEKGCVMNAVSMSDLPRNRPSKIH